MLKPNQQTIDLGNLKYGEEHKFKFELTNTYDKPVSILKLEAGCSSCTKAIASSSIVAPKNNVTIDVIFKPGSLGINLKYIQIVHTIDGQIQPALKLTFKSIVSA